MGKDNVLKGLKRAGEFIAYFGFAKVRNACLPVGRVTQWAQRVRRNYIAFLCVSFASFAIVLYLEQFNYILSRH